MQIIIVQTTKLSVYYPKIPVFGARGLEYFYYFAKHTEVIYICFYLSLSLFFFFGYSHLSEIKVVFFCDFVLHFIA